MLTWTKFNPQVGDIDNNLNRADSVLSKANPQNLDLLVLPELAFSGKSHCIILIIRFAYLLVAGHMRNTTFKL